jgi:hypothetical protein
MSDSDSSSDSDMEDETYVDENFVLGDLSQIETLTVEQAHKESKSNLSRCSISGEVYGKYNKKSSFKPVFIEKDKEVCERLEKRLSGQWMFESLEHKEKETLVSCMKEESFKENDLVIKEGEEGNSLYIIEKGTFN